jgi:cytochrome bd-type quinol oxidase subunit 1
MTGKTMLFEIILTTTSIVALYESWNYLNGANIENYSQIDFIGFALLMISGIQVWKKGQKKQKIKLTKQFLQWSEMESK